MIEEIEDIYNQMTEEDKEHAKTMDFEGMWDEMNDTLRRFVDAIDSGRADDEDIAIIDATMTTAHDVISEGSRLIRTRHGNE